MFEKAVKAVLNALFSEFIEEGSRDLKNIELGIIDGFFVLENLVSAKLQDTRKTLYFFFILYLSTYVAHG